MSFFKRFFTNKESDNFYTMFTALANFSWVEKEKLQNLSSKIPIFFSPHKSDQFSYFLKVGNQPDETWIFPIREEWKCNSHMDYATNEALFEIEVSIDLTLKIGISVRYGIEIADNFRTILSRLIYQTKNRRSYLTCLNPTEIDEIISFIEKKVYNEPSQNLLNLFNTLQKSKEVEFLTLGELLCVSITNNTESSSCKVLIPQAIFSIVQTKKFRFELMILDENGEEKYRSKISKDLAYTFDYAGNLFLWTYYQANQSQCLAFTIQGNKLCALESLFLQIATESANQQAFDQFLASNKENWGEFYTSPSMVIEEPGNKIKSSNYVLDFSEPELEVSFSNAADSSNEKNKHMLQMRFNEQVILSRGNRLDIYKFNPDNSIYDYFTKTSLTQKNETKPQKLELLESSNKIVFNDQNINDSIFLSDIQKETIIREFKPVKEKKVRDFGTVGGKSGAEFGSDLILSLSSNDIVKLDTRVSNGVAQTKHYKSKVDFDKLVTVKNENFAIASENGIIRLYKEIGGIAKNLIPSYLNDKVISLDTSKDGEMLLANFGRYLLLFFTSQEDKSCYSKTFLKTVKQIPKILKVHPSVISSLNLKEISFLNAKFDQPKNGTEQLIIASNDEFYAIWSLSRIVRNDLVTKVVMKSTDKVIQADFKYNQTDIITTYPYKICFSRRKK